MDRICVQTGFLLSADGLKPLPTSGIPDAVVTKLNALKDQFFTARAKFVAALARVLSGDELTQHKRTVSVKARTEKPFKIDPKDGFLARHADPEGKGDFQGCGEFNPVLL